MPEKPAKAKEDKESPVQEQETQEEAALEQPKARPEEKPIEEQPEPQEKAAKSAKQEPEQEANQETSRESPEKPEPAKTGKPRISSGDNVVLVGKKPAMSYVMAVVTQFSGGASEVDIKARGRSISRAVDVAEVARKRFIQDLKYRIEIGTDEITDDHRSRINVSTININLSK